MLTLMTSVALVVGCSFLLPQLVRLVRFHDPSGVSTSAAALGVVQTGGWIVYGLGVGAWAVVVPSGLALPQYICVVLMTATTRSARWRALALVAASGLTITAVTVGAARWGPGPWAGLGFVVTVAVVWQYLPAVVTAHGADGTFGLSIPTWLLTGMNGAVWAMYGATTQAWAVTAYGLVLISAATAVLVAIARDRRATTSSGDRARSRRHRQDRPALASPHPTRRSNCRADASSSSIAASES